MIQRVNIKTLLKEFEIEDIEKHLILHFCQTRELNYQRSSFLNKYFDGFVINEELLGKIVQLNHIELTDLTNDMELLIPKQDKKTNGAFFTPRYIVDYIIETVEPQKGDKVADLSCGSGAFILGLLRYFTTNLHVSVNDCVRNNIFGADILDYNVQRCKTIIILFGLTQNEIVNEQDINVIQTDSLKHKWNLSFDKIVGNPPYVKFQDLDEATRNFLLDNWETTKLGTYNLYFAFFELGLKLLKKEGRLGYITPNNYFTSLSGEYLRTYFQNNNSIYKILDFNSTKVFDVQTYTAITFLNKKKNKSILYDRIDDGETPIDFLSNVEFTPNSYSDLSVKKWRLLCGDERQNIYAIENSGDSLRTLFDICVGIATLKDDAYTFIPKSEDNDYYYISENNKVYKVEKEATRPLVKISEMKCQSDLDNNRKRIIFPYYFDAANKPILYSENDLKTNYPYCFHYLLTKKDILANRGKGNHVYNPFYQYGRTQALNKRGIKIITPTFSQYPRFLIDHYSEGLFTNGYGIYPNKGMGGLFVNPISLEMNFDVVLKILNSSIMHYYVKKTSVSIEGGYPCYQKNFIERFTIPYLSDSDINYLRETEDRLSIDKFLMKKYHINLSGPNLC